MRQIISIPNPQSRRLVTSKPFIMNGKRSEYLSASRFCNYSHDAIQDLSDHLADGIDSERELAVKTFYWVRDNIRYSVGQQSEKASDTLAKGTGSCSNKSNLLVALLRANGIKSGFRIMRVKSKEYFGPVNTPRFQQFMSQVSYHIYACVQIEGEWFAADPSDDVNLSENTQHINPPSKKIEFDGTYDALLNICPTAITEHRSENIALIDDILMKKPRIPAEILQIFNFYVDFIRNNGRGYGCVTTMSVDFFNGISSKQPALYNAFCKYEEILRSQRQNVVPNVSYESPLTH